MTTSTISRFPRLSSIVLVVVVVLVVDFFAVQ